LEKIGDYCASRGNILAREKPEQSERHYCAKFALTAEAVDMNGRFQKQGGKNWILPK
jgi:hypothetical protein